MPLSEAGLPVTDLIIQRGYGIFDFLRIANNIPIYLSDHLERFNASAKEMRMPLLKSTEEIKNIIIQLLYTNKQPNSGVRILLSGGISDDGYGITQPNLVLIQQPITPPSDLMNAKGYKLVTYAHQRQLPQVKTTDYLMAIRLQPWVKEKGANEVLYHQNGIITECPRSNFFIISNHQKIITPKNNILPGITRKQILLIAEQNGLPFEEKDISRSDIEGASEAFISSATKRIIPVAQVDDKVLQSLSKNSITSRLFYLLLAHEKKVNTPFYHIVES